MLTTMKNLVIVFTILYLFNSQLHQGAILLTPYKFVLTMFLWIASILIQHSLWRKTWYLDETPLAIPVSKCINIDILQKIPQDNK